jgi:TRAP-type C4-dicarboxylate transport system permease small subunit
MSHFATIVRKVGDNFMAIGGIFLTGMMALTTTNVIIRLFGGVIAGTYELIEVLIVVVVAGALGYTALEQSHIAVRIVTSRLSQRAKGIFESFNYAIGTGLWVVITWVSIGVLRERWLEEETDLLSVPYLPFRFIWVFGLAFLCLVLLAGLFKSLSQAVKK